jgi:bifunctional DNase/RNase
MDAVLSEVKGVYIAVGDAGSSPAVILQTGEGRFLPIFIGLWEAISIHNALIGEIFPRPLTHDLFVEFFQKFDINLKKLYIDSLEDGIYYARMILVCGDHETSLDCRPSDGIAISIRTKAEVFVDHGVVESSSQPSQDLPRLININEYFVNEGRI